VCCRLPVDRVQCEEDWSGGFMLLGKGWRAGIALARGGGPHSGSRALAVHASVRRLFSTAGGKTFYFARTVSP